MLLEILQHSQENTCATSQACNIIKKKLCHRCFPVNFSKFLTTLFYRTPSNNCFWLQAFSSATLVKRYSDTGVFLYILQNFYKQLLKQLKILHFLIFVLTIVRRSYLKDVSWIAVFKFQKPSAGLQHTTLTLLEIKLFHKYFSKFLSTFLEHLFRWLLGHRLGL